MARKRAQRRKTRGGGGAPVAASGPVGGGAEVDELRQALEAARGRIAELEAELGAARAESEEIRRENEMLEEQLVRLVQEIGHLKFLTERSDLLEREAKLRDQKIAELSADVERLRATLSSGRPTAFAAAAAAARAAQASLFEPRR